VHKQRNDARPDQPDQQPDEPPRSRARATPRTRHGGPLSASIATDGTYTKLGLDLLRERGFDAPWREAIAAIAAKLG
jgi:hypothetical protein